MRREPFLNPLKDPELAFAINLKSFQMECMWDDVPESMMGNMLMLSRALSDESSVAVSAFDVGFGVSSCSK
jgi:hypothetical protein